MTPPLEKGGVGGADLLLLELLQRGEGFFFSNVHRVPRILGIEKPLYSEVPLLDQVKILLLLPHVVPVVGKGLMHPRGDHLMSI